MRRGRPVVVVAGVAVLAVAAASLFFLTKKSPSEQATAALNQGLAAQVAGQLEAAAADYQQVLRYEPKNKYAYFDLGDIAQNQGNNSQAENYYRVAINIDPNFTNALYNLAIVRKAEGDTQGAVTLYRQAIVSSPSNANVHLNLGFALLDLGQQADGKAELLKAIQLDPNLASRVPASDIVTPSPSH